MRLLLILVLAVPTLAQQQATATGTVISGNISTVLWTSVQQQIDGFGAATAYVPTVTSGQADLLWTTASGIGLDFDREFIDCTAGLGGFSGADQNALLASARGAQIWLASSGVPPQWNTTNSCSFSGVQNSPIPADYTNFANYLVAAVNSTLSGHGIQTYALSMQNEPDSCIPTCWDDQEMHDFIAVLGPLMPAGVKLMMPEPSGWGALGSFDDVTMGDSTTAAFVNILAAHGYDQTFGAQNFFGKRLWETEVSTFGDTLDTSIANGIFWAQNIHNYLTQANVNAWHFWSAAYINPTGQTDNECLICNGVNSKRLYTIGNFSKFIRPGWWRIGATDNVGGLNISAYKSSNSPTNTGGFAIVIINPNSSAVTITLSLGGFTCTSVVPNITDATHNLAAQSAVTGSGTSLTVTVQGNQVATFTGTAGT